MPDYEQMELDISNLLRLVCRAQVISRQKWFLSLRG